MKRRIFLPPLAAAIAAVACGGSAGPASNEPSPGATATVADSGGMDFSISAATLAALLPGASEAQRAVLEDGDLTLAEYEAAKLAEVACMRDAGLTVPATIELDGLYRYRYTIYSETRQDGDGAIGRCSREHANVIDMVWAEVSVPLYEEAIVESRRLMKECYDRSGLKVADEPHRSADPEVIAKYANCRANVDEALNMGGVSFGVEGDGRPGYR